MNSLEEINQHAFRWTIYRVGSAEVCGDEVESRRLLTCQCAVLLQSPHIPHLCMYIRKEIDIMHVPLLYVQLAKPVFKRYHMCNGTTYVTLQLHGSEASFTTSCLPCHATKIDSILSRSRRANASYCEPSPTPTCMVFS